MTPDRAWIVSKTRTRFLVQNPPQPHLTSGELDKIHALDFARDVHPYYGAQGRVKRPGDD